MRMVANMLSFFTRTTQKGTCSRGRIWVINTYIGIFTHVSLTLVVHIGLSIAKLTSSHGSSLIGEMIYITGTSRMCNSIAVD